MNTIDPRNFQLIKAASGDVNLVYKNTAIHCNTDPQQEALREFQKLNNLKSSDIVIIAGLGLGYLLKRVFISSKCKIIVYEPEKEILNFSRQAVDFSGELKSNRVFMTGSFDELNAILSGIYGYKSTISVLSLQSAGLLYPGEIENLLFRLPKIEATLKSNYTTLFSKSFKWLFNGLYRLKPGKPDFPVNMLENKFRGKAALIVSAGPSLDKNIDAIKNNRDKFIIFCANVAYKNLATNGIIPDFTVYIDADCYLDTIKNYGHSQTNLISHTTSCFRVFDELTPLRFFTFYCKNDLLSRRVAGLTGFSIEKYETKGSVSHLALLCAFNMGCSPIILTGQDLAYTGGQYYSPGSFWSEDNKDGANNEKFREKIELTRKGPVFEVKGQNGEILKTSPDYAGFIQHFEEFARENSSFARLINCSNGGAEINGFENSSLEETASSLEPVNLDIDSVLDTITRTGADPVKQNYDKILARLEEFAEDAKKFKTLAENGVKYTTSLGREIKKRPLNPAKISRLADKILVLFNEIDAGLFKKWDFSVYTAFKELLEFYALIDDEEAMADASIFSNLYERSCYFFNFTRKRLEILEEILKDPGGKYHKQPEQEYNHTANQP